MAYIREGMKKGERRYPEPFIPSSSDSINSVQLDKLVGPNNYREWKRAMEITLAAKRKLGFVTGLIKKDESDESKAEQWDTCNNMVIAWIMMNVDDSIKKSIMFLNTAHAIWKELETRFSRTDGNRKFQVNRAVYYNWQNGCFVCGGKTHTAEKCWRVIGYPKWHAKSRRFPQKKDKDQAARGKGNKGKNV
ncbi:Retrovirus-related Pol polyprotein from transposon TNT 1-94 [Bienertia sinuspersici]